MPPPQTREVSNKTSLHRMPRKPVAPSRSRPLTEMTEGAPDEDTLRALRHARRPKSAVIRSITAASLASHWPWSSQSLLLIPLPNQRKTRWLTTNRLATHTYSPRHSRHRRLLELLATAQRIATVPTPTPINPSRWAIRVTQRSRADPSQLSRPTLNPPIIRSGPIVCATLPTSFNGLQSPRPSMLFRR